MSENKTNAVPRYLAVPILCRELLPAWAGNVDIPDPVTGFGYSNLPMNKREAESVLHEWQNRTPGELRQEIFSAAADMSGDDGLFPGESADIAAFVGEDTNQNGKNAVLRRAHVLLLLAAAQSRRVVEVNSLNKKYTDQAARLASLLAGDDAEDAPLSVRPPESFGDAEALLPPWKFILGTAAYFLPAETVLIVTDARLAAELAFCAAAETLPDQTLPDGMFGDFVRVKTSLNRVLGVSLPDEIGGIERVFIVRR